MQGYITDIRLFIGITFLLNFNEKEFYEIEKSLTIIIFSIESKLKNLSSSQNKEHFFANKLNIFEHQNRKKWNAIPTSKTKMLFCINRNETFYIKKKQIVIGTHGKQESKCDTVEQDKSESVL